MALPNATLLAGWPRGRGVIAVGCAATTSKSSALEQGLHRGAEKREDGGVGVTIGNVHSFSLVARVGREWLGALRWAGEVVVCIGSVFGRRAWRRVIFSGEGRGGACNANRQNPLLDGRLGGRGTPDYLGYVHQTCSLPGEPMHAKTPHVTKLKSGLDCSK